MDFKLLGSSSYTEIFWGRYLNFSATYREVINISKIERLIHEMKGV